MLKEDVEKKYIHINFYIKKILLRLLQPLQQYDLECSPMTNGGRTENVGNEITLYVIC